MEQPEVLFADGLDAALIGFGRRFSELVAVYSYSKCIDIFVKSGMSHEEAVEYMEYNVIGAYLGSRTPIFMVEGLKRDRELIQ